MKKLSLEENERVNKVLSEVERIGELMGTPLNESSLSRVWRHSEEFDVAMVTAFRNKKENCVEGENDGTEFSYKENLERNKDLKSVLLKMGYSVTNIKGSYIENFETPQAVEVSENSFFVVNVNNDENFKSVISKLGTYFCQDTILYKKKGDDAVLIGTNNSDFPGFGNEFKLGKFKGGKDAEFMSKVNNRPFYFGESYLGHNTSGKYLINLQSKKIIEELKL